MLIPFWHNNSPRNKGLRIFLFSIQIAKNLLFFPISKASLFPFFSHKGVRPDDKKNRRLRWYNFPHLKVIIYPLRFLSDFQFWCKHAGIVKLWFCTVLTEFRFFEANVFGRSISTENNYTAIITQLKPSLIQRVMCDWEFYLSFNLNCYWQSDLTFPIFSKKICGNR